MYLNPVFQLSTLKGAFRKWQIGKYDHMRKDSSDANLFPECSENNFLSKIFYLL